MKDISEFINSLGGAIITAEECRALLKPSGEDGRMMLPWPYCYYENTVLYDIIMQGKRKRQRP